MRKRTTAERIGEVVDAAFQVFVLGGFFLILVGVIVVANTESQSTNDALEIAEIIGVCFGPLALVEVFVGWRVWVDSEDYWWNRR